MRYIIACFLLINHLRDPHLPAGGADPAHFVAPFAGPDPFELDLGELFDIFQGEHDWRQVGGVTVKFKSGVTAVLPYRIRIEFAFSNQIESGSVFNRIVSHFFTFKYIY